VAGLLAMFFVPSAEDMRSPNQTQIRAYLVSKLTDAQLMTLHQDSVREFEEHKTFQEGAVKEYWAERAKRQQACEANPAAKLRDPRGCDERPPNFADIDKPLMGSETIERVFERNLNRPVRRGRNRS
jgi:hypothetical protein